MLMDLGPGSFAMPHKIFQLIIGLFLGGGLHRVVCVLVGAEETVGPNKHNQAKNRVK